MAPEICIVPHAKTSMRYLAKVHLPGMKGYDKFVADKSKPRQRADRARSTTTLSPSEMPHCEHVSGRHIDCAESDSGWTGVSSLVSIEVQGMNKCELDCTAL